MRQSSAQSAPSNVVYFPGVRPLHIPKPKVKKQSPASRRRRESVSSDVDGFDISSYITLGGKLPVTRYIAGAGFEEHGIEEGDLLFVDEDWRKSDAYLCYGTVHGKRTIDSADSFREGNIIGAVVFVLKHMPVY